MYSAILWDMDGTLVDSEPLWEIATYEMSEAMGRRITPGIRRQTIGGTFENTAQLCADHAGITLTPKAREQYRVTLFERMKGLLRTELQLRPGVRELLEELRAADTPMMLVTNTSREVAAPAIEAIGLHYFNSTICGDEVSVGKPDPEIYLTAAARLGFKPGQCLAFEDSRAGMTAAVAAGCKVVGLPEHSEVPPGAVDMRQLHGSTSFIGVTAATCAEWFGA